MKKSPGKNSRPSTKPERLLVVGGGGSRGAWGAGFAQHLVQKIHHQPYRYVVGTSTGSLMSPLIVLNDFETLKTAYTTVTQKEIFDVNPFKSNGELRSLNAIERLITHKKTFGESHNLRKWIESFLTVDRYNAIVNAAPERKILVCYLNFNTGEAGYQSSGKEVDRDTMINWIWASANEPLFMTFVGPPRLQDGNYVDGGVRDNVPIVRALQFAVDLNINDIDIIVNKPADPIINKNFEPKNNIIANLLRLIEIWKTEIMLDDIKIAELLNRLSKNRAPQDKGRGKEGERHLNLTFHYMPKKLFEENENESVFDKTKMKAMWKNGEEGKEDPKRSFTFSRKSIRGLLDL